MAKLTEGERLVKLETQVDAILNVVTEIRIDNKDFREKLEAALPTYATEDFVNTIKTELQKEISQSRSSRLKDLIIQALIIGPISALLGYFFASITK